MRNGSLDGLREICHDIRQPLARALALAGAAPTEPELPQDGRSRPEQIIELAEWQSDMEENWLEISASHACPATGHTDAVRVVNAAERLIWGERSADATCPM